VNVIYLVLKRFTVARSSGGILKHRNLVLRNRGWFILALGKHQKHGSSSIFNG
jgi:hypothetical protein